MLLAGCPDEMVVGYVATRCQVLEDFGAFVAEYLSRHVSLRSCLLDLESMFVGAGAQQSCLPSQDLPALDDVREDHGIEMTDMRS